MTSITSVTVADIRFPTSLTMDGSDAMNKDGDYSAAYVVLATDDPGLVGLRLHLHHRPRQRPRAPRRRASAALPLVGRDVDELRRRPRRRSTASSQSDSQLRWLGPGEGRRPPRPGRGDERGLGPRRPAGRQAAVAAARRHDARAARRRRRPALPLRRPHPRRGARDAAASWSRPAPSASPSSSAAAATPATPPAPAGSATPTTSCAGCCRRPSTPGYRHVKLKVGADLEDDIRRLRIAREVIGWDANLMIDANQVWDVPEAIEWVGRARRVPAAVDRGADQPRRRARPRRRSAGRSRRSASPPASTA